MNTPVEQLTELLPPPPPGVATPIDWKACAQSMGRNLPADYRAFMEVYGAGVIDDQLEVAPPVSGTYASDVLTIADITPAESSTKWLAMTKSTFPIWPAAGSLLCWGRLKSYGDTNAFLYWRTDAVDPDEWPVVLWRRRLEKFEEHSCGMVGFLSQTLREAPGLPTDYRDVFGAPDSRFLNQNEITRLEAGGEDPWEYLDDLHSRFDDLGNPL